MDANKDIINTAASGDEVVCPGCSTVNKATSQFCSACGGTLPKASDAPASNAVPAFAPVSEPAEPAKEADAPAPAAEPVKKAEKYHEPTSVFAEGLPAWSLEPPQVMVRRR